MTTDVRVEKSKWDGTVTARHGGRLLACDAERVTWLVPAGTVRERPVKGEPETVEHDEVWVAAPGQWWVLCAQSDGHGVLTDFVLHAATPFETPTDAVVRWVDLDLDFEVHGSHISIEDEEQFHEHARSMSYPDDVVRGAWSGISDIAPLYTTGEWPFDGSLQRCMDTVRRD